MNKQRYLVNVALLGLSSGLLAVPVRQPDPGPSSVGPGESPRKIGQKQNGKIERFVETEVSGCTVSQYQVTNSSSPALSGIYAAKNGLESLLPFTDEGTVTKRLNNDAVEKQLVKPCLNSVVAMRQKRLAKGYSEDQILIHLSHAKKLTYKEISSLDIFLLQTEKAVIMIDKDIDPKERETIYALTHLIPGAAHALTEGHLAKKGLSFSHNQIVDALVAEAKSSKTQEVKALTKKDISHHLKSLKNISCRIVHTRNKDVLHSGKQVHCTRLYGPDDDTKAPDGAWLSGAELKELIQRERTQPSQYFKDLLNEAKELAAEHNADAESCFPLLQDEKAPVRILSYSDPETLDEKISNGIELNGLSNELKKKPDDFQTLFLISCSDKNWISCAIKKHRDDVSFIVTDSQNKDRQKEPGIIKLASTIRSALNYTPVVPNKNTNLYQNLVDNKANSQKDGETPVNYDAPLVNVPDEALPPFELLWGGTVPNTIKARLKQLKQTDVDLSQAGTKLKNCLILYGPPGTGKSTIAQWMARMTDRKIVYSGGGDFRTAFQGSGKAKLDALFAEAKKLGRCIVIIDEIDGTTSKLEPRNSTQEDNRVIKALITTLDQLRYNPDIYVICTTNYPEKMDPAVLRRFNSIEVPLPDYTGRKKILKYILNMAQISVENNNPHAISPYFYTRLVSATQGFSGDALTDMINNAKFEASEGLDPEEDVSIWFKFNGINFSEKSLVSNALEILFAPAIPLFHLTGDNNLEKHIYSQYVRCVKLRKDLVENELKNDLLYKYVKYSQEPQVLAKYTGLKTADLFHTYLCNGIIGAVVASVAWLGVRNALPKVVDYIKEKNPLHQETEKPVIVPVEEKA